MCMHVHRCGCPTYGMPHMCPSHLSCTTAAPLLPSLRLLDISANGLRKLPTWLPRSLVELRASGNELTEAPGWLAARLPALEVLVLHHNAINHVSRQLTGL